MDIKTYTLAVRSGLRCGILRPPVCFKDTAWFSNASGRAPNNTSSGVRTWFSNASGTLPLGVEWCHSCGPCMLLAFKASLVQTPKGLVWTPPVTLPDARRPSLEHARSVCSGGANTLHGGCYRRPKAQRGLALTSRLLPSPEGPERVARASGCGRRPKA